MKHTFLLSGILMLCASLPLSATDWPQWRGPQRNGVSQETGLLKEWPKEGPKLQWKKTDTGLGYGAPSVVADRIFLLANDGLENEFVQALESKGGKLTKGGKLIWRTHLGKVGNPKQNPNFPAARSTPTVEGDVLYVLGSDGDLACVEIATGRTRWQKSFRADFGGRPGDWAYSESPLVEGDTLVCTPGGSEATLVGLNKKTGQVIWKCPLPEGDQAAYASAITVEMGGIKEYVQLLQKGLVGVQAGTGKFLWRYRKPVSVYGANIPTPLASDGLIYVSSAGTGGGAVRLKPNGQAIEPEELYFDPKQPTAIGGTVKIGEYLYGTTAQALLCTEFSSGRLKWQDRALGAASLCYADGRLYLHGENGEVGLVDPSPDAYREKGRFAPPDQPKHPNQMEKAWAHPVVANGRLYIRDHNLLWCYDVKAGNPP